MLALGFINNKSIESKCFESRLASFLKEDFWYHLRSRVSELDIPESVEVVYAGSSLTFNDRRRSRFVKITTTGEIHTDIRLKNGNFRSNAQVYSTIADTVDCFVSQVVQTLPVKFRNEVPTAQ